MSEHVSAEIVQNGDGFEVRPAGVGGGGSRVSVDMDITVPKKALLTVHSEKGDVSVSDMASQVSVDNGNGDIEVRGDRKSTRLNSSHTVISYAVFCLKKKKNKKRARSEGLLG